MKRITTPFTPDQVVSLNAYQQSGIMHPFTCAHRGDGQHREMWGDTGVLVATINGWVCPFCPYTQAWAYEFMADGQWREILRVLTSDTESLVEKGVGDTQKVGPDD